MATIIDYFSKKKESSLPISIVTCYDYSFARLVAQTSIDVILVGDSLGMVIQGHDNTLPVTLEEMIYHTKAVKRGAVGKYIIADLPFLSYQISVEEGIRSAGKLIKETGCDAVKLEGASAKTLEIIEALCEIGIPVMGHLGLTPQSFQTLGGFKVQGKNENTANKIFEDSIELEKSGVFSMVLEMLPEKLGQKISSSLMIPTIGIGAGRYTDGQVLVMNDLLGMNEEFHPKFLKKFANLSEIVRNSLQNFAKEVLTKKFPSEENRFD
ncbi:MAG: 3-methyl-2-oxobutanoate hydroxymethyltransferase [Leptospiraceae bacterium]|nr:3-methyl-2-oxobutanoate hydroxymethyltransferase [Leptospiraceae bacterium]